MRNPNGFGSVYQCASRRNPWRAVTSSKHGRQNLGYFATKSDALKALVAFDKSKVTRKEDITLKEVYDEWATLHYTRVTKQTQDCYKAAYKYLAPLYGVRFADIRTSEMQRIVDKVYKTRSKQTVKNIKTVLNMLFQYASENDITSKNYAEFLKLPKEAKKEKTYFTDFEVKAIEKSKEEWADTILIMIYSGLRITEMLSITKFNIDTKQWTIKGGIKSEAGKNRCIPIHKKIRPAVRKWLDTDGTYLINKDGKKITSDNYRKDLYYPTLEAIGVRPLSPHACRRTCATMLSQAGAKTIAIQRIMGHEKYATTADDYTATDINDLRSAIDLLK